jgi:hypothetical protein
MDELERIVGDARMLADPPLPIVSDIAVPNS